VAHEFTLLSPEKTILTYRIAGVGTRTLAHLLDVLIIFSVIYALSMFLMLVLAFIDPGIALAIVLIISSLGYFVYFILLEGLWQGQTIGKVAFGLRVKMADGTPVTFAGALARNLLRPADLLPGTYFVGLLAMFTNPLSQRVGDLVGHTMVVHHRRAVPLFRPAPHSLGLHPLEEAVGELRGMTQDEYAALKKLCDRYPELPTSIQHKLIQEVWVPIARRRAVPDIPNVHSLYIAEAVVMRFGRTHGLL
jgi:uncharacterized RDD family membrane protein YckC